MSLPESIENGINNRESLVYKYESEPFISLQELSLVFP